MRIPEARRRINEPTVTVRVLAHHAASPADGCVFVMNNYSDNGFLNVRTGEDVSIGEFANLVADVVAFRGRLVFDTSRPDGAPRKLLDVSKLAELGW